jgi:hypothetical protein
LFGFATTKGVADDDAVAVAVLTLIEKIAVLVGTMNGGPAEDERVAELLVADGARETEELATVGLAEVGRVTGVFAEDDDRETVELPTAGLAGDGCVTGVLAEIGLRDDVELTIVALAKVVAFRLELDESLDADEDADLDEEEERVTAPLAT